MKTSIPQTMHAWRKDKDNSKPVEGMGTSPCTQSTIYRVPGQAFGRGCDQSLLDVEDRPQFEEKYILGHEGCGQIVAIGNEVDDSRFELGSRIAILAVPGCGKGICSECSRDLAQLCPTGKHHGIGQDGFYAEYVAIDVRAAIPVPDAVPSAVAAVATDAVTTAYHGIVRPAEVRKSEAVFLFGLGGLGFNALQIGKEIGARVIVSDIRPEKLDAAAELGVSSGAIVPVGTPVQDFVQGNSLQGKVDTVLDFVGSNQTFRDAQSIVRPGGKILCIGTDDRQNQLDMKIGIRKRLSIIFSYGGQYRDLVEVLDLIAKGIIRPQVETRGLRDLPGVLKDLGKGKIRDRVALFNV